MVHYRMQATELSTRSLAALISGKKKSYSHATVWGWLLSLEGGPPRTTYTQELNVLIAKALDIQSSTLAQAYEESRRALLLTETGKGHSGKLGVLRRLFDSSPGKTWTSEELVLLIDDIQN